MSIARQSIGGLSVAGVPVATAYPSSSQEPYSFPAAISAYTFTPPVPGRWKFVGWGPGANGVGGSGAYVEITRLLTPTQPVTIMAAFGGIDTTITFSDGVVAKAGKATASAGGTASGGDVNLNGSSASVGNPGNAGLGSGGGAGGAAPNGFGGGAGAPANLPYRGGEGASDAGAGANLAASVGSGGSGVASGASGGGPGLVLAVYLGAS